MDRQTSWRQFMEHRFAGVEVIEEVAFGGVSFRVPGTEELAIVGDLSPLAAPAEFEIILCSKDPAALPRLGESLLVPLAGESFTDAGELDGPADADADACWPPTTRSWPRP